MGRKLGKSGLRTSVAASAIIAPVAFAIAPATQASATPQTPLPITTISAGGHGISTKNGDDGALSGAIATADKNFVSFTQSPVTGGANDVMSFNTSSLAAIDNAILSTDKNNDSSDYTSVSVTANFVVSHLDGSSTNLDPITIKRTNVQYNAVNLATKYGGKPNTLKLNNSNFVFQPGDAVSVNITVVSSNFDDNGNSAIATATDTYTPYASFTQPDLYATATLPKATVLGQSQLYSPSGLADEY